MHFDQLFPGRFLKSGEFKGLDVTLTIQKIFLEEMPDEKTGGVRAKGIIAFEKTPKQWVLNKTNATCLRAMFGVETDEWIGKRVTLYPAPYTDPFTGELGTAIRVRGSPDITVSKPVEIKMHKRRPVSVTMITTGKKTAPQQKAARVAVEAPSSGMDAETGEAAPSTDAEQPF